MKSKVIVPVLPAFLFAIYTVLALFAFNLGEVSPAMIIRPLLVVVLLAVILTGLFRVILKEWPKAGLMAAWGLFLFLTYGHVYNLARNFGWASFMAHHRVLLPLWTLLFLGVLILLIRRKRPVGNVLIILNVILGALILFSVVTVARHVVAQTIAERSFQPEETQAQGLTMPINPPDIYYILLDGYTRSDVLSTRFGFDNSDFLANLEALGFYIADCSQSNYKHTHLTLPSLMNMVYIEDLVGEIPEGATIDSLRFEFADQEQPGHAEP